MADLNEVIGHYGKPDFENVLVETLEEDPSALPLQHFCYEGGFPDDENVQCSVVSTKEDKGYVTIKIRCFFKELVPTACADVRLNNSAIAEFDVVLDLDDGTARIEGGSEYD